MMTLFDILEEKKKYKIPEKKEIIEEMKKLSDALRVLENITEMDKPLSQESMTFFGQTPQASIIKETFLYLISEKIKNLVDQNKENLKTEFIYNIGTYYIWISSMNNFAYQAVEFDISEQPPKIVSTVYDTNQVQNEIDELNRIKGQLMSELEKLSIQITKEKEKKNKMKDNAANFIPHVDLENFYPRDFFEQPRMISEIEKQQEVIEYLDYKIKSIQKKNRKNK